ncbi:hypothetical protein ABN034_07840 [Actinopolymorpha sp. B11F2]|uniref:hypothetical protein n=1 Tax=Actinopolymorpha sp. B11F2 TaxID=3160862 RepID=UPI0032E4F2B1
MAHTIQSKVPVVLGTPEAAEIWVAANLAARDALLSGNGGKVAVDIDELVAILSERLRAEGVDVPADLPAHSSRVVLVASPAVARAREGSQLTTMLARALPLVAGALLLLALLISARRFRTLAIAGIGVSVVALVEILAVRLGRDRYLATVDDDTSRALLDAVAQAFPDRCVPTCSCCSSRPSPSRSSASSSASSPGGGRATISTSNASRRPRRPGKAAARANVVGSRS